MGKGRNLGHRYPLSPCFQLIRPGPYHYRQRASADAADPSTVEVVLGSKQDKIPLIYKPSFTTSSLWISCRLLDTFLSFPFTSQPAGMILVTITKYSTADDLSYLGTDK